MHTPMIARTGKDEMRLWRDPGSPKEETLWRMNDPPQREMKLKKSVHGAGGPGRCT